MTAQDWEEAPHGYGRSSRWNDGRCVCGRPPRDQLHNRPEMDPAKPDTTAVAFIEALTGVTLGEWQRNVLNLFFEVKP